MKNFPFPKEFTWGAATASYQVEGAWDLEGKGLSVWDIFSRKPGAVYNGHTGDVACDHFHRFVDDISLMSWLGLKAYRFSISWPRVIPEGIGQVNSKGLDFYDRLVDALLAAGIQPFVTLFHWDYPQALFCRGGWLNPDSSHWFADYTRVVVDRLSDRVTTWMTLNEPQVFIGDGHISGDHAPGLKLSRKEGLLAIHHALLAHGRSVQTIRSSSKTPSRVGIAPIGGVKLPKSSDPQDIEQARSAMFATGFAPWWSVSWFADPIFFKQYPDEAARDFAADMPPVAGGDMDLIAQPLDFYGINIYHGDPGWTRARMMEIQPAGAPQTYYHWPVIPEALYWGPRLTWERYKIPIYITENGMGGMDWVAHDGKVYDFARVDFLSLYLHQLQRAVAEGVDVRGYFQWSLLDNFEWADGYRQRFGLVHVDYQTQVRTPKISASYYRNVIKENAVLLADENETLLDIVPL